jgi:hypothetical protein
MDIMGSRMIGFDSVGQTSRNEMQTLKRWSTLGLGHQLQC